MMSCCNFMGGGTWMMLFGGIIWLLVIAFLVLGVIALWKHIAKK